MTLPGSSFPALAVGEAALSRWAAAWGTAKAVVHLAAVDLRAVDLRAVDLGAVDLGAPEPARSPWSGSPVRAFHCLFLECPDSQVFPVYAVSATTVTSWW
jgi:hypothetical protein